MVEGRGEGGMYVQVQMMCGCGCGFGCVLDTVHWFSGGLALVVGGRRDSWIWRSLSVVSLFLHNTENGNW